MSETLLKNLQLQQRQMSSRAMYLVLTAAASIHIFLNVFAYLNHDPILKVEMPILSAITFAAVVISIKVFRHK